MRALLALVLAFLAPGSRAAEIIVHAASSLSDALSEAAVAHEAATGTKVVLNLAGSNALARQIVKGAPGDVFMPADEERMDQVEKAGLLVPGTRRVLLSNALVVVVAADSSVPLTSSKDLARPEITAVALADPSAVPAGTYARAHLRRIGAWETVEPKVIPAENVRGALLAVELGNADAAIVYATDARASTKVRMAATIPADEAPAIRYPIAVLKGSEHPEAARAFAAFLASNEGLAIFGRHGFIVPEGEGR